MIIMVRDLLKIKELAGESSKGNLETGNEGFMWMGLSRSIYGDF